MLRTIFRRKAPTHRAPRIHTFPRSMQAPRRWWGEPDVWGQ
jgi:hypothetical protein